MNIAAAFLFVTLTLAQAGSPIGNVIRGDGNARFAGLADRVTLDVDPSMVIVGDRLTVLTSPDKKDGSPHPAGRITVTSIDNDAILGVVTEAMREIPLPSPVIVEWKESEASRLYHPLMAWLASTGRVDPLRPVTVAVADVTDAAGDRTLLSDALRNELAATLCARGAFVCVPHDRISSALWRRGGGTTAQLPDKTLARLGDEVEAAMVIEGRIVVTGDRIDTLVTLHPVSGGDPVWWRIGQSMARFPFDDPSQVTVAGRRPALSRLIVRLDNPDAFGAIGTDELTYVNLLPRIKKAGVEGAPLRADHYFVELDGRRYPMQGDGLFFDGALSVGLAELRIGFTPVALTAEGAIPLDPPVTRSLSIRLRPQTNETVRFAGEVRNGHGGLVARKDATTEIAGR